MGLVGEREVLGGDPLRSLQGLRRPADQQPDVVEAQEGCQFPADDKSKGKEISLLASFNV